MRRGGRCACGGGLSSPSSFWAGTSYRNRRTQTVRLQGMWPVFCSTPAFFPTRKGDSGTNSNLVPVTLSTFQHRLRRTESLLTLLGNDAPVTSPLPLRVTMLYNGDSVSQRGAPVANYRCPHLRRPPALGHRLPHREATPPVLPARALNQHTQRGLHPAPLPRPESIHGSRRLYRAERPQEQETAPPSGIAFACPFATRGGHSGCQAASELNTGTSTRRTI